MIPVFKPRHLVSGMVNVWTQAPFWCEKCLVWNQFPAGFSGIGLRLRFALCNGSFDACWWGFMDFSRCSLPWGQLWARLQSRLSLSQRSALSSRNWDVPL